MYTGYFTLDSPSVYLQTFISLPTVCARVRRACVCVCVCVCVNFYFSCHSLYLLFVGVFCSVCIIGESLIFLLSWKWMTFDLLKNIIYTFLWLFLSDKLRLISPYEKGWNLKNGGQGYKRHISFSARWTRRHRISRLWNLRSKGVLFALPEDFAWRPVWCDVQLPRSHSNSQRTSTVWL